MWDERATPGTVVLVGTDLVSVDRIESMLADTPGLANRVFTERELKYAAGNRSEAEHLAARFAAKEAVFKALGTGLSRGAEWLDVEVVRGASGKPRLRLHGRAQEIAREKGVSSMEISLSHTAGLAIAFAVLVCDEQAIAAERRAALVDVRRSG